MIAFQLCFLVFLYVILFFTLVHLQFFFLAFMVELFFHLSLFYLLDIKGLALRFVFLLLLPQSRIFPLITFTLLQF